MQVRLSFKIHVPIISVFVILGKFVKDMFSTAVTKLISFKNAASAFQKSEAKYIRDVMPELITSQKVIR